MLLRARGPLSRRYRNEEKVRVKKGCLRLTKNFEFMNVYKAGRRWSSPFFTMYIKKNDLGQLRLGVSVSKKLGKSVIRNRIKRRIKEAFKINQEFIKTGHDVVVSARSGAESLDFWQVEKEIKELLKRGRLWHDKKSDNMGDKDI